MKVDKDDFGHWKALDEVSLAQSCEPHKAGVSKIAVERRRGNVVLSGGSDGGLCLLDVRALAEPARAVVQPCQVVAAQTLAEGCCSAQELGLGHRGRVEVAAWLPEDDRLFVSGGDRCLKVWDASSPEACVAPVDMRSAVLAGALTKGPPACAAAALADGTVRIVDLRIGRAVSTLTGHTQAPLCVAWGSPESHRLFSGGMDGTLRAWDARMGARSLFLFDPYANEKDQPPLKRMESEEEVLKSRGGFAFARAMQQKPKLDTNARFQPYVRRTMSGVFAAAKTETSNCGRVFETGAPPTIETSLATGTASASSSTGWQEAERERLLREKWSRDAAERARHFLEPPRRTYTHEPSVAHHGAIIGAAFVAQPPPGLGARVVSCGVDGKVRVWDADTGSPAGPKPAFDVECWSKEVSLQIGVYGLDICIVPERDKVATYCMNTGRLICHFAAHTSQVTCAEAVGENAEVLSGGDDGRLLCWRLAQCPPEKCRRARSEPAINGEVICLD